MKDNSIITNNKAHCSGGGVCVGLKGTFTMDNGEISSNIAESQISNNAYIQDGGGGGIYISTDGIFTMNSGTIKKNTAGLDGYENDKNYKANGGGINSNWKSTNPIIIKKAIISENEAKRSGGGIYSSRSITIEDSSIENNKAESTGGGACIFDNFEMNNAIINKNEAESSGGAFVSKNFKMEGKSEICNNTSINGASGICLHGTGTITDGIISNNKTTGQYSDSTGGILLKLSESTLNVSGNPIITGNIKEIDHSINNVYLSENKIINVIGKLGERANIGVTVEDEPTTGGRRKIADGSNGYAILSGNEKNFTSDNIRYKTIFDNGMVYLGERPDSEKSVTFYYYEGKTKECIVEKDKTVNEPTDTTREGYTLEGWYQNENFTGDKWDFKNNTVEENMTLYAKWIQNEYTVTFNSKDGSNVPKQTVKHGEKVEKPNPEPQKDGSTFGGWYEDENCSENKKWNFDTPVIKNMTLYAKWNDTNTPPPEDVKEFTVAFNTNGGSKVPSQTIKENEKVSKPDDPTKTNSTFAGWYKDENCTQEYDFNEPVTKSFTLYAKWNNENTPPSEDVKEFTVTFNTNGGSTIASQKVQPNAKAIKPTTPTKSGYTFKGWFTNISYSQEYDFDTAVTADMTLFAKWEENKTTPSNPTPPETKYYTVTFESNGGSEISSQTISSGETAMLPQNPIKNDYEFLGWFADKEFNKVYQFSSPVTSNITLYAKWKSNNCIVTFESNGGSEIPSQTVEIGKTADMPKSPIKSGYSFLGWFADENFNEVYRFSTPVTNNITIYAKWKAKSHSSGGGGGSSSSGRTGTWVTEEPKITQITIQPSTQYQAVKQECLRN